MQNTRHLLMIKPVNFGFNEQTAVNNSFQKNSNKDVQQNALQEFNAFVDVLRKNKIDVTVVEDSLFPQTPDSIFPNNWISFDADGSVFLYPMFAVNRRLERKPAVLEAIKSRFSVSKVFDLTKYETEGVFLEGTGSMVLDRENKIAYASVSPRTNKIVLDEFCKITGYKPITFNASDEHTVDIYHTNVMMCVAKSFAVVCLESVTDEGEKVTLLNSLKQTGKEIINISLQQLNHFAGNMLQVINEDGELLLVMSTQAYHSLSASQTNALEKHCCIIHADLNHIETAGGGSARCMMAEIFLPVKEKTAQ